VIRRTIVTAALALLALTGAAGAGAHAPTAPRVDTSRVALELTQYGPAVVTPEDDLAATMTISNTSAIALQDLEVTVSVTSASLNSSFALQHFLDDPAAAQTRVATTRAVTAQGLSVNGVPGVLPPGGTLTTTVTSTPSSLGLPRGTSGVYGVVFTVRSAGTALTTRTAAFTWYDAEIPMLRVALLATASGSPERVTQVLSAASVDGAAVVMDPVTVTDDSQASALTANREVFGLPSGDPDLTSLAHSDDDDLLAFALHDAANNAVASLQDLPWLATLPVVDAPTIALASASGAIAGVVNTTGGTRIDSSAPVVDVIAGDRVLPVLNPHRQLSTILATYRPGMPDAAARVVAEAALAAKAGDGATPVVVAPGEAWQLTAPGVSDAVYQLLNAPWVVPISVHSVITGDSRDSLTAPDSAGTDNDLAPDLITALSRQLTDAGQLAQTVEDPTLVYVPAGRTLLEPLAVGLRTDPDARTATYTAARDDVNATLGSVYVAEGSDVNLIASKGSVPVSLHNDLPVDATVTVVMRSSSPNLVVGNAPVVTIPAGGDVTAHIDVTGVKSANVTATVTLKNAEADVVAAPQVLRVRVRADWGNAMTAIFTVGIVALLVAGLVRTFRRGRRSSRMAPMPDSETGGSDG